MSKLSIVDRTKLNLNSVTVLVAGGAVIETDMLMQLFAGFGVGRMLRADDPQSVKDSVEYEETDLVVLDLKLGAFATTELLTWLRRRRGDLRLTPAVLVAANVTPTVVTEARNSGVNYIMAKPVTPRVMFERLVWVVKEHRKFIEAENYVGPDRRVRPLGPPPGLAGRRAGDLSAEVGEAVAPNMSQADIDAMMFPARKVL